MATQHQHAQAGTVSPLEELNVFEHHSTSSIAVMLTASMGMTLSHTPFVPSLSGGGAKTRAPIERTRARDKRISAMPD